MWRWDFGECSRRMVVCSAPHGIVLYYGDDMFITDDNAVGIQFAKQHLQRQIQMKNLGHQHYFLGLEISQSPDSAILSLQKYVLDFLDRTTFSGLKTIDTPL